jgi:hypothetical protein
MYNHSRTGEPIFYTHHETLSEKSIDSYSNFSGEVIPDNFVIVYGRNRDSDILNNSNFETFLSSLGGESDTVRVDSFNHWGCGWFEYISVDTGDEEKIIIAEETHCALSEYPVLDEEDYSRRQEEQAQETWRDCYNTRNRIEYFKKHRDYFPDTITKSEMIALFSGETFTGYASELLS